jgi:hypothetical protein
LKRQTVENAYVNELVVSVSTFDGSTSDQQNLYEKILIPNIPMKKWVCCTDNGTA